MYHCLPECLSECSQETTEGDMAFILCACRVCPPRDHCGWHGLYTLYLPCLSTQRPLWVTWPLYFIPAVSDHPDTTVGDMAFILYTCRVCPPRDHCGWHDLYTLFLPCLSTQRPLQVKAVSPMTVSGLVCRVGNATTEPASVIRNFPRWLPTRLVVRKMRGFYIYIYIYIYKIQNSKFRARAFKGLKE